MDVLQPNLLWVDGRCYRSYCNDDQNQQSNNEIPSNLEHYDYDEDNYDLVENMEIEELNDQRLRTSINIPNVLFKFLIGPKGSVKRRIESETSSRILIPRKGEGDTVVIITDNGNSLASAYRRLSMIADSSRFKQSITHFISIPLNYEILQNSLNDLKQKVLAECSESRGIEEGLFQNPLKLHLTIGTLILLNEDDRNVASDFLKQALDEIIIPLCGDMPKLKVSGLEYMNDDPSEVDVLYAKVTCNNGRLQEIVDGIAEKFSESGLMVKQHDRVKIHATVMNSLFKLKSSEHDEAKPLKRQTFDARRVFENFKDYDFGEVAWSEIHLSQLHSTASNGYYNPTLQLPVAIL